MGDLPYRSLREIPVAVSPLIGWHFRACRPSNGALGGLRGVRRRFVDSRSKAVCRVTPA